jgi:rhomboid protease GluP
MCPNCRALLSRADRVCPYCEFELAPAPKWQAQPVRVDSGLIAGLIPADRFGTVLVLTLNAGLFIVTDFTPLGQALKLSGAMHGGRVFGAGEWWRLITAGFFHGGLLHILSNSWALMSLGAQVEEIYGTRRFALLYILTTIGGFTFSGLLNRGLSVGASAGLFGLLGVLVAIGLKDRSSFGRQIGAAYSQYALFAVITSFLPGIDFWAHLGGMATGFGLGWLLGLPVWGSRGRTTGLDWLSWAALAAAVAAFIRMMLAFISFIY